MRHCWYISVGISPTFFAFWLEHESRYTYDHESRDSEPVNGKADSGVEVRTSNGYSDTSTLGHLSVSSPKAFNTLLMNQEKFDQRECV